MKYIICCCFIIGSLGAGSCFAEDGTDIANILAATLVSSTYKKVVSAAENISDYKKNSNEPYLAAQKQLAGQIESIKKAQTTAVVAMIKEHALALIAHQNAMNYSESSKSLTPCADQEKAIGVLEGSANQKIIQKTIYDAMMDRNSNSLSSNETRKKLDDFIDNRSLTAGSTLLLDGGNTMTKEQSAEASRVAFVIVNQSPDYKLISEEQFSSEAGEKYQAIRKMKIAKLSLSEKIMTNYLARKAATYPLGEWANNIEATTHDISESTVVDGKVSADTILDLEVRSRYMNPQFEKKLHTKSEVGVLHEILAMQAVSTEFQRLELEHQEYMTALTAFRSGTLSQEINGALSEQMNDQILQSNYKHER